MYQFIVRVRGPIWHGGDDGYDTGGYGEYDTGSHLCPEAAELVCVDY